MIKIRRGTTPTITITIPSGIDPANATAIWLTIAQNNAVVVKLTAPTVSGQKVIATLTQAQTLALSSATLAKMQLRMLISSVAYGSQAADVKVLPCLDGEVIS